MVIHTPHDQSPQRIQTSAPIIDGKTKDLNTQPRPTAWLIGLRIIGRLLTIMNPGFAYCQRCYWPWTHVTPHTFYMTEHHHYITAMCKRCWTTASLNERLYYHYVTITTYYHHTHPSQTPTSLDNLTPAQLWETLNTAMLKDQSP